MLNCSVPMRKIMHPSWRTGVCLLFWLLACGFRWPCYIFCSDQTSIQEDYVEKRDRCRELAELKADMASQAAPGDDKTRKTRLVSLFSECMHGNGWAVPNPADTAAKTAQTSPPPAAAQQPRADVFPSPMPLYTPAGPGSEPGDAAKAPDQRYATRAAECAFARQGRYRSRVAASRAEACDLECAQQRRMAPDTPTPAACPPDESSLPTTAGMNEPRRLPENPELATAPLPLLNAPLEDGKATTLKKRTAKTKAKKKSAAKKTPSAQKKTAAPAAQKKASVVDTPKDPVSALEKTLKR